MNVNIGIITTEIHLSNFKKLETEIKKICNVKYFIVKKIDDCKDAYLQNYKYVDAFICSGPVFYQLLIKEFKYLETPCYTIYDDYANVYKQLMTIILHNPDIKCSRMYIDFANEYNDYLGLKEVFAECDMPYLIPWNSENLELISPIVLNNHLQLWKENKIDLSITRYGHLTEELEKNNIKYEFLTPSGKYIIDLINKAVTEVKLNKLNDNKMAAVYISLDNFSLYNFDNYKLNFELLSIQGEAVKFFQNYDYDAVVQRRDNLIEIFTTVEDIFAITHNLSNCDLLSYISSVLNYSISIGYGCGNSISQSIMNAMNANKHAREQGGNCSFFIGENQEVVGPIAENQELTFLHSPDSRILELSEKLEINNIYVQKIISFAKKAGTNKLSSEDVAECLSVAQRSSNRILNKIEEKNAARITYEKRDSSKGRPKKYYELSFIDNEGNVLI